MTSLLNHPDTVTISVSEIFENLEAEVESLLEGFDQRRKRVTGRHRVSPHTTAPSPLPDATPFPVRLSRTGVAGLLPRQEQADRDDSGSRLCAPVGSPTTPHISTALRSSLRRPAPSLPTVQVTVFPRLAEIPPSRVGNLSPTPPSARSSPADGAADRTGEQGAGETARVVSPLPAALPEAIPEAVAEEDADASLLCPSFPSLTLVSALPDETLEIWLAEIREAIEKRDLGAILDGVFWAHPDRKLSPSVRLQLVQALYRVGGDSSEVQRLAIHLSLSRHEPHEPIQRASLRFLQHTFHTLPTIPSEVLLTFLQAGDPGEEPRESVRIQSYAFLSSAFPFWSSVRQHVYRILWLRLEPSFFCRLFLLERLLDWLPEAEATERERLEGLYLLHRALGDPNESVHLRFSLARKLLDTRFTFLPPEAQRFVHLQVFPLCRQVLSEFGRPLSSAQG
jgi:hypothetical protein